MKNTINFSISPSQLIRQRHSCRTYQQRPLSEQDLRSFEHSSQKYHTGPMGNQPRFSILPASRYLEHDLPRLGTYGFIKDPAAYLIGIIHNKPGALEDLGYCMELLILKATELELGSCWLGVTFTKDHFAHLIGLHPDESIPAVASLGYPSDHRAWLDRAARIFTGSDHRLPWERLFFANNWDQPLKMEDAGDFLEPLHSVRLAPSASNKQPWRLLQEGALWHFYLERTPNYPSPIYDYLLGIADLQRIDMGIAMAHFVLGLEESGLRGEWCSADPLLEYPGKAREYVISWQPTNG